MKSDELRSLQAPLKNKYRDNPEAALVTFTTRGRLKEGITCEVETKKNIAKAGLHPAAGGNDLNLCSGDMLLEALVACTGVTLNSVATAMDIQLKDAIITATGVLDFRGTLGVSKEVPVGFQNINIDFRLDTDASSEQIDKLLKLTERYCVVYQTLNHSPSFNISFEITRL